MFLCVFHCIAQDRRAVSFKPILCFEIIVSILSLSEEYFQLFRDESCFYFTTAVIEFDTDYYYEFYDEYHFAATVVINAPGKMASK